MKEHDRININVSHPYDVIVGRDLLDNTGELLLEIKDPCKVLVITDNYVDKLYFSKLKASLMGSGFGVLKFVIQRGEASKSLDVYKSILEFMARQNYHRNDLIIALGGGVVGDLAGFVAATYNRGVDFMQMPTTFLAAIDSSVGGKTGLNLTSGKNLVGAFKQPVAVICDINLMATLEDHYFEEGVAEAIKYAVLRNDFMLTYFEEHKLNYEDENLSKIIKRCVEYKRDIVIEDEFDQGQRQLLNFGHTFGHAIEKARYYAIGHGQAVAMGMGIMARAAYRKGICSIDVPTRIAKALEKNHLPNNTNVLASSLYENALLDKKATSDNITIIVPEKIEECKLLKIGFDELEEFAKLGVDDL